MPKLRVATRAAAVLALAVTLFTLAGPGTRLAAALAKQGENFGGTTWTFQRAHGPTTTIRFNADGTFSEDWKNVHTTGQWHANAKGTKIDVTRSDGKELHFWLRDDGKLIRTLGNLAYELSEGSPSAVSTAKEDSTPSTPDHNVPTVKLTQDQARAVVLIKGDNGAGTGFLVKTKDGPAVITNQHVIANNPNVRITTSTGQAIEIVSYKGATDRDLAMIAIKDGAYSYLTLAPDVTAVQPGDEVITPGNSEGGDVLLNTDGKVLGIGPDRVEIDNPIYHGNSGGPAFDVKTGQVVGVVTEAIKVENADDLDKASFASRKSAIQGSMRYFAMRVDNVPKWEDLDWNAFQSETAFLDKFDQRSRALYSFLNTSNSKDDDDANLWQEDSALKKANDEFESHASGDADTGQKLDALRELFGSVVDAARDDVTTIQNSGNFYLYDRVRAKDELEYRQEILKYLDSVGNNVDRLGHLPRTNN